MADEVGQTLFFGVLRSEASPLAKSICVNTEASPPSDVPTHQTDDFSTTSPAVEVEASETLTDLNRNFFAQIHSMIEGLPTLLAMRPMIRGLISERTVDFAAEIGEEVTDYVGNWKFYKIDPDKSDRLRRHLEKARREQAALDHLSEMVLLGSVSLYDAFVGRLVHLLLEQRPDIVSKSEKSFPAHQVLQYSDIQAFRDAVIEKTVESFLRESHEGQFRWLESNFDVKLTKNLEVWPNFIEIFERRNLVAHSRGRVSETYKIKCLEAGLEKLPDKGTKLRVNYRYIKDCLEIFAEVGLKLTQVLSRKIDNSDANLNELSKILNSNAYDLISHKHFKLAIALLDFGLKYCKTPDETISLMMEVNIANAYALLGDYGKAEAVLKKRQWATTSTSYLICVSAIRRDYQKVAALVPTFFPDHFDPRKAFKQWPVFAHVQHNNDFREAFKIRFDEDYLADFEHQPDPSVDEDVMDSSENEKE